MNTPNLPPNHEPLPADFLRKHGAVKGMKYKHRDPLSMPRHWVDWQPHFNFTSASFNAFNYCAPIGTCAAAYAPLPVLDCDCGCDGEECFSNCASNRRYRHILPHELAAMESKPEGLQWACAGGDDWELLTDEEWKVFQKDKVCNLKDWAERLAYAVPVRAEEGKPSGCSVERQLTQLQETITLREFAIAQLTRERDGLRTSLANAREHLQMVAAERDFLARQLDLANELRPLSTQTRKEGGVEKPTAEAADANANVLGSCSGASPDSSPLSQPQSETGTQDYQQIANGLHQQLNAMRAAIERELARWDRDGEPCKCGTCAVCGLRASIQPK